MAHPRTCGGVSPDRRTPGAGGETGAGGGFGCGAAGSLTAPLCGRIGARAAAASGGFGTGPTLVWSPHRHPGGRPEYEDPCSNRLPDGGARGEGPESSPGTRLGPSKYRGRPGPCRNGAFRLLGRVSFPNTVPGKGRRTLVGSGDHPKGWRRRVGRPEMRRPTDRGGRLTQRRRRSSCG
jgi:hypothetical protein